MLYNGQVAGSYDLLRGSVAVAWMAGAHLWLCGFEEIWALMHINEMGAAAFRHKCQVKSEKETKLFQCKVRYLYLITNTIYSYVSLNWIRMVENVKSNGNYWL